MPQADKTTTPAQQREALRRSERKAAEQQPGSFKDAETAEKVVEIGPDLQDAPIEGIDPTDRPARPTAAAPSSVGEEDPGAALDDPTMRDAMQAEARLVQKRR